MPVEIICCAESLRTDTSRELTDERFSMTKVMLSMRCELALVQKMTTTHFNSDCVLTGLWHSGHTSSERLIPSADGLTKDL